VILNLLCVLVEYWRNRYQRMNKERFVAANAIALITHTVVSNRISLIICYLYRPNPSILLKLDVKCSKKVKPLRVLVSKEDSTHSKSMTRYYKLVVE
jgi:hypothetical protein